MLQFDVLIKWRCTCDDVRVWYL